MARKLSAKWRKILLGIPGYDPFRDADGCWFDESRAVRSVSMIEQSCKHVEGETAGQPFTLQPWQVSLTANLFGWLKKDEKGRTVRRFREILLYIPRKNGKTAFGAALVILTLFFDDEAGSQVFSAAADKDQATLVFRQVRGMISQAPALNKRCKIYEAHKSVQLLNDKASVYRALSSEAYTKHGLNCHAAIIDELHAQPNRELVDVLKSSMGVRTQPLTIYLTTADWMRESICNETYDYACRVRDGHLIDPTFLPVIFEASKDDDWRAESTWRKANPNLGVTISLDFLRSECKRAQEVPAYENTFRRLYLNQRTEQDTRAIPMDQWEACGHGCTDPVGWRSTKLAALVGLECYGGLDIGSTNDLTALALEFPGIKPHPVLCWFWATEAAVERRRRMRINYDLWAKQGFITVTSGNVTDYDFVRRDIGTIADKFGIRELAVDRLFQGAQLCTQLMGDGLNVIAFGQGFLSMASPTKRLLEKIAGREIDHGNNPVLSWHAGNASTDMDAAGNLKFSKSTSSEKIDGIVALTMAGGRVDLAAGPSVYESRGIDSINLEPDKVEEQPVPILADEPLKLDWADEDD